MSEKIEVQQALKAFQTIIDLGERTERGHELGGLIATSDVDGYTVQISDGTVTLHLMFHQKFAVDTPNRRATANFMKRLDHLLEHYA
ncbi:MAG: DUF3081 domain-containing protein [Saccharospirillum sp.]|nr:DUF3081 domain-containing protein [Saccharospirillum sp.]